MVLGDLLTYNGLLRVCAEGSMDYLWLLRQVLGLGSRVLGFVSLLFRWFTVRATKDFRRHGHGRQQRGCPNQLLSDGCSVLIRVLDDYEDDLDDEDKEDEDEDQDDHDDDDDDNRATTMRRRHVATSRLAP